jgi:GDP-L-fucose synthase
MSSSMSASIPLRDGETIDYSGVEVLVTGASGLIGRELVHMLVERGARVRGLARRKVLDPEEGVDYRIGDLMSRAFCAQSVAGCRYVFHLAGIRGSVGLGRTRAADFFVNNILMNTHMMEEARKAGVDRYLFASSVCVYAPAERFVEDRAWDAPPHPSDAFAGWAKRMGELQAVAYREQYGWDAIAIVRPVNVYGPWDNFDPATAQVIPALIARVLGGENPLTVWGDGTAVRDFLYSRDAARGMLLAFERHACCEAVNLGSGRGYAVAEIVDAVLEATGAAPRIIWDASRPSGERYRVADATRARRELGFEPVTGLKDGIRQTVEWYRRNADRVRARRASFEDVGAA